MPKDTPILVAFSGGADSRALLDLLCRYAKIAGTKIYAAHVNHGIRGEEAQRDEDFCVRVAKKYGITAFVHKADIPVLAKERRQSVELCARDERYSFFAKVMKENSIPLLATAHNANDNLETVLFNLSRGSGLSGLCGIPPTRECDGGKLIRPILRMSREEILEYCTENELDYVTDSTNLSTDYTRNKIRAHVVPVLKQISATPEKKAADTSALLRRDEELLSSLADTLIKQNRRDDGSIPLPVINSAHPSIASRAIMALYSQKANESLSLVHVEDVLALCKKGVPHSRISLPLQIWAVIENEHLSFTAQNEMDKFIPSPFCCEAKNGTSFISQINAEIIIEKTQSRPNIYKKSIQISFDSAKINGKLILRSRNEGDRILLYGMHKSVKKLMCDKKIPVSLRARIPMICDDEGIVAIPFIGVCDRARVKKNDGNANITEIEFYLY